ncbi:hypothetical protein [Paramicrobacterium chengjingii]|uniref:hypothetical protein n=1 Tax=Paramicrobacterium chengjingii TaxID=2769067 RepID=UPI00141ED484|nr:hypothetical protein [Microbacterium chengjingii]
MSFLVLMGAELAVLIGLSALVPFSLPVVYMVALIAVLEASRNADRNTRIEQGTMSL